MGPPVCGRWARDDSRPTANRRAPIGWSRRFRLVTSAGDVRERHGAVAKRGRFTRSEDRCAAREIRSGRPAGPAAREECRDTGSRNDQFERRRGNDGTRCVQIHGGDSNADSFTVYLGHWFDFLEKLTKPQVRQIPCFPSCGCGRSDVGLR